MKVDVGDDGCHNFPRKVATKAKAGICDKMLCHSTNSAQ